MGCIKSTGRSTSPPRDYGDDTGAQGASSSNRTGIVENLTSARAFNSLLRKAGRFVTNLNNLNNQNPSRWGELRQSALNFHERLSTRAESDSGDSLETYTQEFEALKERLQNT